MPPAPARDAAAAAVASALVLTRDPLLLDDLQRLGAAAGLPVQVARTSADALRTWSSASAVLVGWDLAAEVADRRPPRRDQVLLVGHGDGDDTVFRHALLAGACDVVELPSMETWLVELLTDAADAQEEPAAPVGEAPARGPARPRVVGVIGGSGGSGATTFACALGLTAARTRPAVLIDLDPLGPGVDKVVGVDEQGARWAGFTLSQGRLGSRSFRAALPARDGLAVLTWEPGPTVEPEAGAVREVLSAARRSSGVVVVDLPRAWTEATAETVSRCDAVFLVAEASVSGVASASRVSAVLGSLQDAVHLAVRQGRGALSAGQVASALGLPVATEVPWSRRLGEQVELGLGPVHRSRSALARAARAALDSIGALDGIRP